MWDRIHLWLNNNYTTIKHWLLVVLGVALLVFSLITIAGQNKLLTQVKTLSEQNKSLGKANKDLNGQTKKLGQENQSIAKQNRSYIACVAQIFAKYTRDGTPILSINLDTCTIDSQTAATNSTATGGTPISGTSSSTSSGKSAVSASSSESVSSPQNNTTSPTPPANIPQQPKLLDCKIDLLGIHLGCP